MSENTTKGYTAEQIQEQLNDDNFGGYFSGDHYPNEAEREHLPAVAVGATLVSTAARRAGSTYDGVEPVDWTWITRNAGESAKFNIEVDDTKEYNVNMLLKTLYSDANPIAVTDVHTHYSTLVLKASVWDRHVEQWESDDDEDDQ